MQKGHSKIYIDPVHLLESGNQIEGEVSISSLGDFLDRIDNAAKSNESKVCFYSIKGSIGKSGKICIEGNLSCSLSMICQRCLEEFDMVVKQEFALYPISESNLKSLDKGVDPLILTSKGDFVLNDLICDELLLMVPYAPKHEDCNIKN
jgi:uncharacterized metal-binding protein YceD (DUF177 family)